MSRNKEVTILLVEDDPGHARLIEKNLRRSNITNDVVIVTDGQQALDYLFGQDSSNSGPSAEFTPSRDERLRTGPSIPLRTGPSGRCGGDERPSPLLVLLDLNLPVLDGYQVLQRLKADERTRRIPVVILTTTDDAREVARCYELGCSIYVTKPVDYSQFSEAIRKLGLFLSVVTVPDGE